MNKAALIGLSGLLAAALLIAACSQAPPSKGPAPPQGAPPTTAGANTGAATSDADLIGSPSQPTEPGDPSLLGNDTSGDTSITS